MSSMRRRLQDIRTFWAKLSNERGSTTVFTAIIMASIVMLAVMLVTFSKEKAEIGRADSLLSLSSRSVLSQYCIPLKERYGIMAMDTTPLKIENGLRFYMMQNDPDLNIESINVKMQGYTLFDIENIEGEIEEYFLFLLGKDLLAKDNANDQRDDTLVLRNKKIISMLPSGAKSGSNVSVDAIAEVLEDVDNFFDTTKRAAAVNEYLMRVCNNHSSDDGETFFKNEIEYLIQGELADCENYLQVKNKIKLLRNIVNFATIFSTPALLEEVSALAATTGIAIGAATIMIAEGWALLEAQNDVAILENGGKIPILKTKETWATDIGSIAAGKKEGYTDKHCETGMDYEDYLRVFLYFTDKETKLTRFMDLMQLYVQGKYDENFLVKTTCTGYSFDAKINGRKYKYVEKY